MEAYYFIDPISGKEILHVPRNFVASLKCRRFEVNYNPRTLSRSAKITNTEIFKKALEWGLVQSVNVDDSDLREFREHCFKDNHYEARSIAGKIFAIAKEDIEFMNSDLVEEDDEDEDDEDEE